MAEDRRLVSDRRIIGMLAGTAGTADALPLRLALPANALLLGGDPRGPRLDPHVCPGARQALPHRARCEIPAEGFRSGRHGAAEGRGQAARATGVAGGQAGAGATPGQAVRPGSPLRRAARYAWAVLLARIDEVFPLRCPNGGGDMRIIAFITATAVVRDILLALGQPIAPPTIAPARGGCGPQWTMPPATPRRVMRSPRTSSPHPHRTSSSISASPGSQASARAAMTRRRAACVSRRPPPAVCPVALCCRRDRPGNLPQHRVGGGSSAPARRLTSIAEPGIPRFARLNFLSFPHSRWRFCAGVRRTG